MDTGADHAVVDDALCRSFSWSDGRPGFDSVSCYAVPAFLSAEFYNRRSLDKVLAGAGAKLSDQNPYWPEAELSFQDQLQDRLSKRATADGFEYRLGDKIVVRASGRAAELSPAEAQALIRFLARHEHIHPQLRRDLKAGGVLPARLELTQIIMGDAHQQALTITNVHRAKAAFPLPAGLTSNLRLNLVRGDTPLARGIAQTLLAIDDRSTIPRPSANALVAAMQQASDHDRELEAISLFLMYTQQYGAQIQGPDHDKILAVLRPILLKAQKDPAAQELVAIQGLAGDAQAPGDREAAARFLAQAAVFDPLPFGSFRFVTFANLRRNSANSDKWDPQILKAMPSGTDAYWTHIAAYPWAGNAFKDIGDAYYENFDTINAWLAFDLGREVDKDWRGGVLKSLSDYEDKLRTTAPDFF